MLEKRVGESINHLVQPTECVPTMHIEIARVVSHRAGFRLCALRIDIQRRLVIGR
jgi:hypothetical protein